MTDIEKSKDDVKREGQQSVDPFARLRASMKKMTGNGAVIRGGKLEMIVDGSSSMHDPCMTRGGVSCNKHQAVTKVVNDILAKYTSHVPINLIEFTMTARQMSDMNDYPTGGGTRICPALQLLVTPGSQVVLLSDGDSSGHDEIMVEAQRLAQQKIVVNCIGVGVSHSGEQLLRNLADATGGQYVGIEADLQLIFDTFKQLASKAVAALTAGQGAIAQRSGS